MSSVQPTWLRARARLLDPVDNAGRYREMFTAEHEGRPAWAIRMHIQPSILPRTPPPHENVVEVFDQYNDDGHPVFFIERLAGVSLHAIGERHNALIARVHGGRCLECGDSIHAYRTGWGIQVICEGCGGMFDPAALPAPPREGMHAFFGTPMWLEHAVGLARHAVSALAHLQQHSLASRGLNPMRLIVTTSGVVKLVDPHLTNITADDPTAPVPPISWHYRYLSPEGCHGLEPTSASDVYAVASMLYELTTGRHLAAPWDTEFTFLSRVTQKQAPPPSSLIDDYPPQLEALIVPAIDLDPQARPSLDELATGLDDLITSMGLDVGADHLLEYLRCLAAPSEAWIEELRP